MTHITGGDGPDDLSGAEQADVIRGLAGDDTLRGAGGDDKLYGGTGSNLLDGGDGFDTANFSDAVGDLRVNLNAGSAEHDGGAMDTLVGVEGIVGGAGNDSIRGGDGADMLDGGAGRDVLFGGGGNNTLIGGDGNDDITTTGGSDLVYGGADNDDFTVSALSSTVYGGAGYDQFDVDARAVLYGGQGLDKFVLSYLSSEAPEVTIHGGAGDDVDYGWTAKVVAFGGAGDDRLQGLTLHGQDGADYLDLTGPGAQLADGGEGFDTAQVHGGADLRIRGEQVWAGGTFVLKGVEALDGDGVLVGDRDHNVLTMLSSEVDSTLRGLGGDDTLVRRDTYFEEHGKLDGGAGDDTLIANRRYTTLHGGDGADTFLITADDLSKPADPSIATLIDDLEGADTIDLSKFSEKYGHDFRLVDHFDGSADEIQLVYDKAQHMTWIEGTVDSDADVELLIGLSGKHMDDVHFVF